MLQISILLLSCPTCPVIFMVYWHSCNSQQKHHSIFRENGTVHKPPKYILDLESQGACSFKADLFSKYKLHLYTLSCDLILYKRKCFVGSPFLLTFQFHFINILRFCFCSLYSKAEKGCACTLGYRHTCNCFSILESLHKG